MSEPAFRPTSHPELFLDESGFLYHVELGPLGLRSADGLQTPDGAALRLYDDAPPVTIEDVRKASPKSQPRDARIQPASDRLARVVGPGFVAVLELATKFAADASSWIALGQFVHQVIDLITGYDDSTSPIIARIDRQLGDALIRIGQVDYLNLMRRMSDMRGNAMAIRRKLESIRGQLASIDPEAWYDRELAALDAELIGDIESLLDPAESYFRRVYVEELARGDGLWQTTMPDRANENGTTFEYRLALPTLMLLINVRLAVMKLRDPRFGQMTGVHEEGQFGSEIRWWWTRLHQLAGRMASYVRPTSLVKIEIQSMRRRTFGGQEVGRFSNWQTHCSIPPPNSVNPVGAVDITTGTSWIDWEHVQFDEWYLAKGNLHGQGGGYWPPSVGPQLYRPPPNAVGLPPLDRSIEEFYSICQNDALNFKSEAIARIGCHDVTAFANHVLRIGFPHSPI